MKIPSLQIIDRCNKLSLRAKLTFGFLLVLSSTVIVGTTSLFIVKRGAAAIERLLDTETRIADISRHSEVTVRLTRQNEKDFLLQYRILGFDEAKARYATLLKVEVTEIHQNMDAIRHLIADDTVISQTRTVDQAVDQFELKFVATTESIKQRGFFDLGVEGQFRNKIHEVEAILTQQRADSLLVDMLALRRMEKDFLLRDRKQGPLSVQESATHLQRRIAGSNLQPDLKDALGKLVSDYQALFEQYVQLDEQITTETETYRTAIHSVEPLLGQIRTWALRRAEASRAQVLQSSKTNERIVLVTVPIAILLGLLVTFFISRSIAGGVTACMVFAGRLAQGDLSARMKRSSHGEFGAIATALNRMAEQFQNGRADLLAEITERKRAEEASRQSEEKFREVADNITDVFWMMSLDMREVIYVSQAYETVWGFSIQSFHTDPHQWSDAILPEDRQGVLAAFAELSDAAPSLDLEYRIRRSDGSVHWIHDRAFLVRDAAGKPVRTAGISTDITELKHAAASLEKSEAHKSAIVASALDCIITMDANGHITEFNPSAEETFGHQRSAMLGKKFADVIVPPAWRADHLEQMAAYLAAQEADAHALEKRIERSALRADGMEFPVEFAVTGATIQGERSITIFARDITERKHAERRVEALHKELLDASRRAGMAEVATGVLHNVGNVLNSINVSTSIVVDRLHKSRVSRLTEVVKMLADHAGDLPAFLTVDQRGRNLPEFLAQLAAHLNRETTEIAEEMRAVAGNVEHIKEIVSTQQSYAGSFGVLESLDLRDTIEDALRIHGAALNRHDVAIERKLEPIATVVVDKHKVLQILVNLISNAKYAMADSPVKTLTIKTYPSSDGGIQVSIHDTGCGIVAENIARIFAHGFTTKRDGHGFGLHSSALAAKEMNALLIAHSDGVGQGAVFTLVFPPVIPAQVAA